nr:class I SAM-dependent methyltransferase [Pseudomonas gingeri]
MGKVYRSPFESAFTFLKGNGKDKRLLEVGCSSGKQLEFFTALGYSSVGVSPGAEAAEGGVLIDDFYENVMFSQEFDCVVSRFNLEHIVDLDLFFRKVRSELKEGGCFVVQVPNVEAFSEAGLLNIFAHEHPHYFCKKSLSSLLNRVGFELEFIDAQGPSIIAMARSVSKTFSPVQLISKARDIMEKIVSLMEAGDGRRFIFYGAGLSLTGLLYLDRRLMAIEDSIVLVDDNPILLGRYMPNTNIMVSAFEDVSFRSSDVLFVLLNEVYHSRVSERVASTGAGCVYWLTGEGLVSDELGAL